MRCRPSPGSLSSSLLFTTKLTLLPATVFLFAFSAGPLCQAQDQPQNNDQANPQTQTSVTVPAGTRVALVLTQPIQSRYVHRGDDVYAQVISPVHSDNEVAIPPGTFVQGTVDKIERRGGRGEIRLQSMSITFPDGYVTPIEGPMTLETDEGYALKDPGSKRMVGAIAFPAVGAGIGALIGHSVTPSSSTLTSSLPAGCTGPPPGCLSSSVTVPGSAGRNTVIGAGVGGAIGAVASIALLMTSHHFYLDVGAPIEMQLQHPVTIQESEARKAVLDSEKQQGEEVMAVRPLPRPSPPSSLPNGFPPPTTPGTPPTIIPGVPGPNGVPGPPTIIPGTPPTT